MHNHSTSKRISIALPPELYSLISDLGTLQNKAMSVVVVESLTHLIPTFEVVRATLIKAQDKSDKATLNALRSLASEYLHDVSSDLELYAQQLEQL